MSRVQEFFRWFCCTGSDVARSNRVDPAPKRYGRTRDGKSVKTTNNPGLGSTWGQQTLSTSKFAGLPERPAGQGWLGVSTANYAGLKAAENPVSRDNFETSGV